MGRPLTGWIAGVAVWLGLVEVPADDPGRLARIHTLYGGSPGVPEIGADALRTRLAAGDDLVLVDVRTPEEQAVSTLPGAVPAARIDADVGAWRGRRLVAYCTIGARSGKWAAQRRQDGLDVVNLAGGVLAWTHAGGTLVAEGALTQRVHVYGAAWDLARTDHVAVW